MTAESKSICAHHFQGEGSIDGRVRRPKSDSSTAVKAPLSGLRGSICNNRVTVARLGKILGVGRNPIPYRLLCNGLTLILYALVAEDGMAR